MRHAHAASGALLVRINGCVCYSIVAATGGYSLFSSWLAIELQQSY